jgi:DNA invertase Pin-like site-specific DNA recombinase
MQYFLYARKSSESEDRQMLSIEAQIQELKDFAKKNNLEIVKTFTESMSAKAPGRTVFNQMLTELECGTADGILAWHPDRLARNMFDGGKLLHLIDKNIITDLKFPSFYFDKSANGIFNLSIAFSQAQYFVQGLRENVLRGIRQKLRRGEYPGKAPYGYINNLKTKTIEPDPEYFHIIQKLLNKFSEGNMTQAMFRKELFNHGLQTKNGNQLNYASLFHILTNPFYYGVFRLNGELHQGSHQPMISKETYDKIQEVLKSKTRKVNHSEEKKKEKNYLFQGLARCGNCGYGIVPEWHKKKSGLVFKYYRCSRKSRVCTCDEKPVNENHLAQQVEEFISHIAMPNDCYKKLQERTKQWADEDTKNSKVALQGLSTELTSIQNKLNQLLDLQLDGEISVAEYKNKKNTLIEKKANLEDQKAKVLAKGSIWVEPLEDWMKTCNQAAQSLKSQNFQEMNRILQKIGLNHRISKKKLDIQFVKPYDFLFEIQPLTDSCSSPVKFTDITNHQTQRSSALARDARG